MPNRTTLANERIRAIAAGQHGVVSRQQLVAAGIPGSTVRHRLATGAMQKLARGVYAVGPIRGPHWRYWSGLLLGGATSVLSYHSAARILDLDPSPGGRRKVHVSVRAGRPKSRAGFHFYRAPSLASDEEAPVQGLPVTTPARTLLDLARVVPTGALERLAGRADRMCLVDAQAIRDTLRRHPGHNGNARLRKLFAHDVDLAFTRSELEARFLRLVRLGELPAPMVNARVARYEVDFLWNRQRLVAEVDGFRFHSDRAAFEGDRQRDAVLVARGFRVLRFSWRAVVHRPETVLVQVAQALARGA